jgi:hypothetical protein
VFEGKTVHGIDAMRHDRPDDLLWLPLLIAPSCVLIGSSAAQLGAAHVLLG